MTRFFDYEGEGDRGLQPRFRVRLVTDRKVAGRAFLNLIGADAVLFVPHGKGHAEVWGEVKNHFWTYGDRPVVVASLRSLRGVDGVSGAKDGAALAKVTEEEVVRAFRAGELKGRPTMPPSKAYVTRAKTLAAAVEIAMGRSS